MRSSPWNPGPCRPGSWRRDPAPPTACCATGLRHAEPAPAAPGVRRDEVRSLAGTTPPPGHGWWRQPCRELLVGDGTHQREEWAAHGRELQAAGPDGRDQLGQARVGAPQMTQGRAHVVARFVICLVFHPELPPSCQGHGPGSTSILMPRPPPYRQGDLMPQKDMVAALLAAFEKDPDINLHESPIHVTYHDSLRLEGEVANIIVKRKARRIAIQISGLSDHRRPYPAAARRTAHRQGPAGCGGRCPVPGASFPRHPGASQPRHRDHRTGPG